MNNPPNTRENLLKTRETLLQALKQVDSMILELRGIKKFENYDHLKAEINANTALLQPKDIITFTGEGWCTRKDVPFEYQGIVEGKFAFFVSADLEKHGGNMNVWLNK